MQWIDQEARKPQEHIRVLVYVRRRCTERGAVQGMTFAAWHGELGWIGDNLTPLEGVTHWAVIAPPATRKES